MSLMMWLKMYSMLLLVSSASAAIPIDSTVILKETNGVASIIGGKLVADCKVGGEACDFSFNAMASKEGLLKFFFQNGCPKQEAVFIFDGPKEIRKYNLAEMSELVYHVNGFGIDEGGRKAWEDLVRPLGNTVVKVTVQLPSGCGFTLTEGLAVVGGSENSDGTSSNKTKAAGTDYKSIGLGVVIAVLVLALVGAAIFYFCTKKKARVEAPAVVEKVDMSAKKKRRKKEQKGLVKPSAEETAAIQQIKNDKLKTLFPIQEDVDNPNLNGVLYWCLKSACDFRTPPNTLHDVVMASQAWYSVMERESKYFKEGPSAPKLSEAEEAKKVAENKKKFFEMGPPKIKDVEVFDMVVCDSLADYLSKIYVISDEEHLEMDKLDLNGHLCNLMPSEINFYTASLKTASEKWTLFKKDADVCWGKVSHMKTNLPGLYKYLSESNPSTFHYMYCFSQLYGDYINKFPLKLHHLSRLPLQFLLLLMFRPDVDAAMQMKIIGWFKVASFGMMRKRDLGASPKAIAYPMHYIAKLWHEFDFSRVPEAEINELRELLDGADPEPDEDWECM